MTPKILPADAGTTRNILGDNQTVKVSAADSNGTFIVFEQTNPPGVGIPLHVHANEDELFYVIDGHMEFKTAGQSVTAGPGTSVFLPRGVPHEFMVVGEAPAKALVTVVPGGIEAMFEEFAALPPGPPDMPTVLGICANYGITFLAPPEQGKDDLAAV